MPTRLLTVPELAELLRESEWTVRERLRRGEIRGIKKCTAAQARWFVTEKALEAYLNRCMA